MQTNQKIIYTSCFSFLITDHVCDVPGCNSVLVMDGNMKNARQVCLCKNVGQLQFSGLHGTVVVGKQMIPIEKGFL